MVCYNSDKFKQFLQAPNFRKVYDLTDHEFNEIISDDVARLKFGYKLLAQVLYGEKKIPLAEDACDNRMEERKEILDMRHKAEIEAHKDKAPFENYMDN